MDLHIIVSHKVVSISRPRHLHVMTLGRRKVEPANTSKTGEKIAQKSFEQKPANIVEGHIGDRKKAFWEWKIQNIDSKIGTFTAAVMDWGRHFPTHIFVWIVDVNSLIRGGLQNFQLVVASKFYQHFVLKVHMLRLRTSAHLLRTPWSS